MQSSQNVFQMNFQLNIHFFRNSHDTFEQRQKVTEVIPLQEVSHTADNIRHFISDLLLQWDLTTKVVAVVQDGGTDITKAPNDSTFVPVPCSAHLLQCVVRKTFMDNPFLVPKCRKIVSSFKHSNKNTKILNECQNQLALPQHRMIQDVSTRWNSTTHMMKRLNEQKNAIIMASSRKDATISAELMVDEWKKIEHLIDILEIFDTATLQLSKETSSISELIPLMQLIQLHLEIPSPKGTGLQGFRNDLLARLKQGFSFIHTNELTVKATILDPQKHSDFMSSIKDSIVSELEKISVTHGLSPAEKNLVTPFSTMSPQIHIDSSHGIWARYEQLIPSHNVTPHSHTTA
ncbi:hypothetical protein PR048_018432 [Dryococelus australis]|uniref:Transposase n=1 Tax=Dryococelus australis TaxID=614101 RepID=A0ABQ9HCE2_9NEOP|nr:hypothetical protein PR048_018432 [Dryococelus australis]